jgi:hypothetical protein
MRLPATPTREPRVRLAGDMILDLPESYCGVQVADSDSGSDLTHRGLRMLAGLMQLGRATYQ